ncbi:5-carboxymethyl-2-hydroxymuconate isomerase [Mycolicibacterium litorale]|nr:5-carboxymethyl-2-hydroxymuconate isomerase [Mycolicibacterium litorale]
MRIARFGHAGNTYTGAVADGTVHPLRQSLDELIAGAAPEPLPIPPIALADVELHTPISSDCRGVFCVGINYFDHQVESADTFVATVPEHPIIFFKTTSALCAPYDDLNLAADMSSEFDWEVELGVVIGTAGRNIARESAAEHIYGYTVINDITARDVQRRHTQWHLGKNVDRSTPVGPWIVTADEFDDPLELDIALTVNGEPMQRANTRDMIFPVDQQIAVISQYVALRPGDVIATGTPSGVGFARTPPRFLTDGDVVETVIDGVGTLHNRIVARAGAVAVGVS